MIGRDIDGYMGIHTYRSQAPPDNFRSANSISQSKYCVKTSNFRILELLPAEEAR